jgi:hypothetical protein
MGWEFVRLTLFYDFFPRFPIRNSFLAVTLLSKQNKNVSQISASDNMSRGIKLIAGWALCMLSII